MSVCAGGVFVLTTTLARLQAGARPGGRVQLGKTISFGPPTLVTMKYVIDSNQLQSDQLRSFLEKSTTNIAVLPDFVAMEAYKGDPLKTIFKSMSVLSDFPHQVWILKGSAKICGLSGRRKGLQKRLVDEKETQGFPSYVRLLRLAENGNTQLRNQILALGRSANEHLDKMREESINIRSAIEILGVQYSKEERAALRSQEEYTPDLINKLVQTVIEMTGAIFRDSPLIHRHPNFSELPNTFMFRVTFACYLLGLRRFSQGGFGELSPEKLRNDMVDMMLVAYGTFFDGLMSADKNVNYMFQETSLLLSGLMQAEVPSLARLRI